MELLGLVVIMLLYIIILYFINKNKATELVKDLMRYAQISINGGDLKKRICKICRIGIYIWESNHFTIIKNC